MLKSDSTIIIMAFFLICGIMGLAAMKMSLNHDCVRAAIAAKYPAIEIQGICK